MRINSKLGVQHATYDSETAGEGLAIFFSQNAGDVSRYRFQVKAITDQGTLQVGQFFVSPPGATTPTGPLTRMVAGAVCPGAKSWAVEISCADTEITPETANVTLTSSKCCTAPVGVSRVGERYFYLAGNVLGGAVTLPIALGRKLTSWAVAASSGTNGAVQLSANNASIVTVPAGFTASAEPKAQFDGAETITFTNVTYFAEFLESA